MSASELLFRPATIADLSRLEEIRCRAFAPVFQSFREILGDTIYTIAQQHEDNDQARMLEQMFAESSPWALHVALKDSVIAGFVSVRVDQKLSLGEIGLNAVDPEFSGKGIGTKMYGFALDEMRSAGVRVATVSTGGDPSHQPALGAYRRAGFNVEISSVWLCKDLQQQS